VEERPSACLDSRQEDGPACVMRGRDYLGMGKGVPVGRSPTGSPVFACIPGCTALVRCGSSLEVDPATVLLLDVTSQQLVATAAKGIEAVVRQGIRIPPMGKGFAGRIAAEKQPVII
jgi:hypothetical protein